MENVNMGNTQITDKIRVSSAAIFYGGNWFGSYFQYETFIFSDDPSFKTRMFIWGAGGGVIEDKMKALTERAHKRVSKIMLNSKSI